MQLETPVFTTGQLGRRQALDQIRAWISQKAKDIQIMQALVQAGYTPNKSAELLAIAAGYDQYKRWNLVDSYNAGENGHGQ